MPAKRVCNVGPVPSYSYDDLIMAFIKYMDYETNDEMLFELGTYAQKTKGSGVSLPGLASLGILIVFLLAVAPAARFHKVDIRSGFMDALAERPRRIISPKTPKATLAETFSRQVDFSLCKLAKTQISDTSV